MSALPRWPCLRSLVTAGEIHEIQTARKINLSFIFMMVMQQPSTAAFALQLHPSIAARSPLPAPRRVLRPACPSPTEPSDSSWQHLPLIRDRPCICQNPPAPPRQPLPCQRPGWHRVRACSEGFAGLKPVCVRQRG